MADTFLFTTANDIIVAKFGGANSQKAKQNHQEFHDEPENQHPQITFHS